MTPAAAKAEKSSKTFSMACTISTRIEASREKVWALLTDAENFPRWNSTVSRMEGRIAEGERLKITVPVAKDRVFKPRVSNVEPSHSMTWSDGMAPMFRGIRTFTLTPNADGSTSFVMQEELSGLMLPLIKGSLPDFGPIFEAYAADLRRAAEGRAS